MHSRQTVKISTGRMARMYQQKGLVTRYTHVKYEGPNSYQTKDMANVKVFADKETDKRTGQKLLASYLSMQGHKKLL